MTSNRDIFLPPDLDALCSRHFRWRDLIECGETWHRLASGGQRVDNLPREQATWDGLQRLSLVLLDAVTERFGALTLTYCFAGPELTRHIPRRIAPRLDQHAGSEVRRDGKLVCPRMGQAADFRVEGVRAEALAEFIRANVPFDRLYLYDGSDVVHCSVGPEQSRQVVQMVRTASGRLMPRRQIAWNREPPSESPGSCPERLTTRVVRRSS